MRGLRARVYVQVTVYPAPAVTSLSVHSGTTAGGTALLIRGSFYATGFVWLQMNGTGTPTVCALRNSSAVSCSAPKVALPGHTALTLSIDPAGSVAALEYVPVVAAFVYYAPPVCAALTPPLGPIDGATLVVLEGTGFIATPEGVSVTFGGAVASSCVIRSPTSMACTAPPAPGCVSARAGRAGAAPAHWARARGSSSLTAGGGRAPLTCSSR